jgi:dipeptidase E
MMRHKQIIAMGGGGFSMEPDNLLLDRYILQHARTPDPTVCFLPTASGDSADYIARFYTAFSTLPCRPRHLSLFRPPRHLAAFVAECDVIYVGGGNTRNMLAIWRVCELDAMLRRAWEAGVVLCGLSAGAICWFRHGHTDSTGSLGPIDCLGFLPGSCTPHYDGESERRPSFHALLQQGALPAGYALDDGAALHFIGKNVAHIVTSRPTARAFHVRCERGSIIEEPLPTRFLLFANGV